MSSRGRAVLAAWRSPFSSPSRSSPRSSVPGVSSSATRTSRTGPGGASPLQSLAAGRAPFVNDVGLGRTAAPREPERGAPLSDGAAREDRAAGRRLQSPLPAPRALGVLRRAAARPPARRVARARPSSPGSPTPSRDACCRTPPPSRTPAPAASWLPWCGAAALDVVAGAGARGTSSARAAALALALRTAAARGRAGHLAPDDPLLSRPRVSELASAHAARSARPAPLLAAGGACAGSPRRPRRAAPAAARAGLSADLPRPAPLLRARLRRLPLRRMAGPRVALPALLGRPGRARRRRHWQFALHRGDLVYIWCVTFGVIPLALVLLARCARDFWNRRDDLRSRRRAAVRSSFRSGRRSLFWLLRSPPTSRGGCAIRSSSTC